MAAKMTAAELEAQIAEAEARIAKAEAKVAVSASTIAVHNAGMSKRIIQEASAAGRLPTEGVREAADRLAATMEPDELERLLAELPTTKAKAKEPRR